jgi:indolepyruvate ferredoxin oxidoreductase beta subunit
MKNQQIIISGVGGQGVLFVTRLFAEAAIQKGLPVLTSETHGMAQRGGTVLSHLKIGDFASPLIRPHQADGLLALRAENIAQHGFYLMKKGWIVVNGHEAPAVKNGQPVYNVDADQVARELNYPKSVNLIMLGFAMCRLKDNLFCTVEEIKNILTDRMKRQDAMLRTALKALDAGYQCFDSEL